MRTPVIEGPIIRPACQGMEPSAIAFGSRARSTSCGMSESRLGSSKARNALLSAASASRWPTRATPSTVRTKAIVSVSAVRSWVPISRRSRFVRSASTPPKGWKSTIGAPWARPR